MATKKAKIEKLQKKIADIDERMKSDLQLKKQYEKQIEDIKDEEILSVVKASKIALDDDFVHALELAKQLHDKGIHAKDIESLVTDKSLTTTSAPVGQKFEQEETNNV